MSMVVEKPSVDEQKEIEQLRRENEARIDEEAAGEGNAIRYAAGMRMKRAWSA